MTLKQFIEEGFKNHFAKMMAKDVVSKLIELEAIENYLNVMLGIELEITIKPAEKREGRHFGHSAITSLNN